MFEQAVVTTFHPANRTWTTMAGMMTQATLLAAAIMVPLVSPEALPNYRNLVVLIAPGAPPPPPPPPAGDLVQRVTKSEVHSQMVRNVLVLPTRIPERALIIEDPPDMPSGDGAGVIGGVIGGSKDGVLGGLPHAVMTAAMRLLPTIPTAPPAQPAAAAATQKPAEVQRLKVGGNVQEALLIRRIIPTYPRLAVQARVQGVVELLGVIGTDGRVKELRAVSGNPLLVPAALDAVRQWIYRPTFLNGDPVEVVAPITVHFTLAG